MSQRGSKENVHISGGLLLLERKEVKISFHYDSIENVSNTSDVKKKCP